MVWVHTDIHIIFDKDFINGFELRMEIFVAKGEIMNVSAWRVRNHEGKFLTVF